jgi:hypothetical protein
MQKILKEVADTLEDRMNNVEKATSYREGLADGYNLSIRELETTIKNVNKMSPKEQYKYLTEEVLKTIDRVKIGGDDLRPIYIQLKAYKPIKYGIMVGNERMCKNGEFDYEPMPSSRDNEYIEDHSFNSIIEAWDCYDKYHGEVKI